MLVENIIDDSLYPSEEIRRLYARCVSAWGIRDQEDMLQEECGELLVAINHHRRGRVPPEEILEEIADVIFMCDEMMYIHGFERSELARHLRVKVRRTRERVEEYESKVARDAKGCL